MDHVNLADSGIYAVFVQFPIFIREPPVSSTAAVNVVCRFYNQTLMLF